MLPIIRKIDDLGRITIPKDLRNELRLYPNDLIKMEAKEENLIITKTKPSNTYIKFIDKIVNNLYKISNSNIIITNTDEIISYKHIDKNSFHVLEFNGAKSSNSKNMEISNQGGIIVFRNALDNIGNYISNDDDEVNHTELLKKLSIKSEDIKFKVSFDIIINLNSKKTYKANVELELPINDIVNEGIQSVEYTDLENIKLKRSNK